MKNIFFLLLFILIGLMGVAQSNIRLNNYWENTYYINPASIYSEYQFTFSTAARRQWIGFPGAPNTGFFTGTYRPNPTRHVQVGQFGLKAFYDEIGYTRNTNVSFSYSYSVKLQKDLLMNLGLSGNFQNLSFDMSKQHLEIMGDPYIYDTKSNVWDFNPDVGIELVGKSFLMGASGLNIFSMFMQDTKFLTNTNFLYLMYRVKATRPVNVQYGICGIQNANLSQLEFNVTSLFSISQLTDLIQLGVSYRTMNELGFTLGLDLGQFNKRQRDSWRLAFSYDYNFSNIRINSFGTPELLLIWKFGFLPECKCRELFK